MIDGKFDSKCDKSPSDIAVASALAHDLRAATGLAFHIQDINGDNVLQKLIGRQTDQLSGLRFLRVEKRTALLDVVRGPIGPPSRRLSGFL